MRNLPISPAKSSGSNPSLVARADAVLAQLRADVLSSPLPSTADEVSPESFEKQLSAALNRAGCSLLGAVIEELDECRDRLVVDGSIYHCSGRSSGKILSSFGEVAYERSRYRRRDCEAVFPPDERFGVIGGLWSPYAARLGSLSLALAPVKDCEGLFRELGGMRPSATALNHLVVTLGSAWDAVQETALDEIRQAEGVPEEAASVAVSIDGAMLGMRKEKAAPGAGDASRPAGFREASSGTVSLYDADGRSLRTVCFGRMPESGKVSLKEDVLAEVSQVLLLRPDLQLVFISDGAPDHWAWCEEAFPGAIQVYDLWHALQHLKEALDCAYGDGTAEAMLRFEKLRETLKEDPDGIDKVLRSLRYLADKHPRRKTISRVLAFFRKQRHRMKYAEVRERSLAVGSGPVEAANKVLIKSRMKGAGMRWAEYGTGQPILTFRELWKSGRFDAAWRQLSQALQPPEFQFLDRKPGKILKMAI